MRTAVTTVFARFNAVAMGTIEDKSPERPRVVLRRLVAEHFQEFQQRQPVVVQGRCRDAAMRLHPVTKLDEQPGFGNGRLDSLRRMPLVPSRPGT